MTKLSIVMPVLNEAAIIEQTLSSLRPLRARGHEVIVVDGGSDDDTALRARPLADRTISGPRGRAVQMNAGAHEASGAVLVFLHADTRLPPDADRLVLNGLRESKLAWGRFDVSIEGRHPVLRLIAWGMNLRSRLTGVATGDQCIFVYRDAFMRLGGYPPIALMEDIALSKLLRRISGPLCLSDSVRTAGRRWERRGVFRTVLLMSWLRLRYFLGASPAQLERMYESHGR